MEGFSFKYYVMAEFPLLKDEWRRLETGADMTYFQTFRWYEMLWNLNKEVHDPRFEIGFAAVSRHGKTLLIAPLWIVKRTFGKYNRKGFYLFGRGGWSDYLNLIYRDFDGNAVQFMFSCLKEKFGVDEFFFENIEETSQLFGCVMDCLSAFDVASQTCVGLSVKGISFDKYKQQLSKQARQNIRTANNRLARDGKTLTYNFDDSAVNLGEFMGYRTVRVAKKNAWGGKTLKWRVIDFISRRILRRGWYKFPDYAPFTHDSASKFMTAVDADGKLCASFNYGISPDGRSIVLMGVSTNPEFAKYSPGILLLFNFIENTITHNTYDFIDFTRGNESYKYALGGKEHIIKHFTITI